MGMYTGVRFKGYVKPEFRKIFKKIALSGEWKNSKDEVFAEFGKLNRAVLIPCGTLEYMPDEWEEDFLDENGEKVISFWNFYKQKPTDGFDLYYSEVTGYWTFQCSLKNYEFEIEQWIEILPYFIEKIEHLEVFYEEWNYSIRYDFVDGIVAIVDDKFIKYNDYDEDFNIWGFC